MNYWLRLSSVISILQLTMVGILKLVVGCIIDAILICEEISCHYSCESEM